GRTARARNEGISLMLCSSEESSFYRKICQDLKKGHAPETYPRTSCLNSTCLSKLLPNHEKYHHNPIMHKTKSYTFWYSIQNKGNKGVFPKLGLKYTKAPKNYAIPDNFSIITTWGKSPNLNTIKGHIKYIDNPTKTQRFNELSISTKKARSRTVAKKIKKDINQIAKENYHPNDQVTLKELSYTVANTPFHVEFGSQNIIEKNKHEDGYRALSAIQPNLLRDYAVSDQRTILTSKMVNYIPTETFNLYNQDNLLLNKEFQLVKKVVRR
ncbi:21372_t:CDS:2, partial [Gigaspora rosea]